MTTLDVLSMPTMDQINKLKKDYKAISFFSGCGGSSTGYKLAGFDMLYANEFIPEAQATYAANHPKTRLDGSDIRTLDPKKVMKELGIKRGELDLLDGSPPCSSFSNAGTRDKGWGKVKKYSDSEQRTDDLFDEYVRMVDAFYPKVFVAENVPGLVEGKAQGYFVEILGKLKALGYDVSVRILNASYLGVPQARRRLIFVGVRKDLKLKPVHPRPYTYQLSVRDVLPNIHYIKNKRKSILTYVPSDVPSPTITASDGQTSETASFSCGGFVEDKTGVRRKYKISELKKICAFPSDFQLTGTFEQKWERLGRAVPPLMMYNIALAVREEILDVHYKRKHRKDIYWSGK